MKYFWMIAAVCAVVLTLSCSLARDPKTGEFDKSRALMTVKTVLNIWGTEIPTLEKELKCYNASKTFVDSFQNSSDALQILHDYSVVKRDCKGVVDVDKMWSKVSK